MLLCNFTKHGFYLFSGANLVYDYETQVQSKAGAIGGARLDPRRQSLSFKLSAELLLTPVWKQNNEMLYQFQFQNSKLLTWYATRVGTEVTPMQWKNPFFVFYGSENTQLLSEETNLEVLNFQRGLASIFLYKTESLELDEIDVLGQCKTIYNQDRHGLHKLKENCHTQNQQNQNVSKIVIIH